jgi:hypothetical protein
MTFRERALILFFSLPFVFYGLGYRQEQDIYVRLIDSVSKQVTNLFKSFLVVVSFLGILHNSRY